MRTPAVILLLTIALAASSAAPRIACVAAGDAGSVRLTFPGPDAYPSLLAQALGSEIRLFASRAVAGGPPPASFRELEKFSPDAVIIEPLAGDSITPGDSLRARESLTSFVAACHRLGSSPRVILLLPPPLPGVAETTGTVLRDRVLPLIRAVAWATGCEVVDTYSMFLDHRDLFDGAGIASSAAGKIVAGRLAGLLRLQAMPGADIIARAGIRGGLSNYFGYECTTFTFAGREARIVRPKRTAAGSPWIWRARFWGHEPQTEVALLERGFHVVYCDVAELFGNDEALAAWDSFYVMLTRAGLSPRAALEGFSRGGVYVYRWAVHAPEAVACVYADAPVLDFKSWPGGKGKGGGNTEEWDRFKRDFRLASEAEGLAFRGNPLDMAEAIARGGYPMLHVCGLADVVVPFEENTEPFERNILRCGGRITVITKPGIGHHPHSLPNPAPIVDFILRATGQPVD